MAGIRELHLGEKVNAIDPISSPEMFAHLEEMQKRIPLSNMEVDLSSRPIQNVPRDLQAQGMETLDRICESQKASPISRRLLLLTARVAQATEQHIRVKRERDETKKAEAEEKVAQLQGWKGWEAWTQAAGGFGGAFLSLGGLIPGPVGSILSGLSQFSRPAAESLLIYMQGKEVPLSFEKDLYINMSASERQTVESLKRLPEELRRLVMELLSIELQATKATTLQS